MANRKLAYGVDDRPPFPIMVLAGFQHVLTLFGATTLVPLIFGPAMGMNTTQIGFFISCVYFAMGGDRSSSSYWLYEGLVMGLGILLFILLSFLAIKKAQKNFEKVDL
mgnify:CR=1 FL=1